MLKFIALVALLQSGVSWKLQPPTQLKIPGVRLGCVTFSPDGKFIAAGGSNRSVYVWKTSDQTLHAVRRSARAARFIAFTRNGKRLAALSANGGLDVWETKSMSHEYRMPLGIGDPKSLDVGNGGELLVSSCLPESVLVINTEERTKSVLFDRSLCRIESLRRRPTMGVECACAKQGLVAVLVSDGIVKISDSGAKQTFVPIGPGTPLVAKYLPKTGHLAVAFWDSVKIFNDAGILLQSSLRLESAHVMAVASKADFVVLLEYGEKESGLRVVGLPDLRTRARAKVRLGKGLALSHLGKQIATTGRDGTLKLWKVAAIQ